MLKRMFDLFFSGLGLLLLWPLFLVIGLAIKFSSPGPIIFGHLRAGRNHTQLRVWKFRTMVENASSLAGPLTLGDRDPRITAVGYWLRKTKLDELPQLVNVLLGEMSLVGPRPEAWKYVEMFPAEFADILRVRPGITDPASIAFRDEGALLAAASDPEQTYIESILPEKIRLAKAYLKTQSLRGDVQVLAGTLFRLLADRFSNRSRISTISVGRQPR